MKTVCLVDDDYFFAASVAEIIEDIGYSCKCYSSVNDFAREVNSLHPDSLLVDMALPVGESGFVNVIQSRGGHETGIAIIRKVRGVWTDCAITLMTGHPSATARCWCQANSIHYLVKPFERVALERVLGTRCMRSFIVHGRNMSAVDTVKRVLGTIKVDPVVLMEQPNMGRTVIEKFEETSALCDCAIVVFTSDDVGRLAAETEEQAKSRVRQNVLFELGYFCGAFGRRSGRVILIEFGDSEIPSDLAGVIRVNGRDSDDNLAQRLSAELKTNPSAQGFANQLTC